jgi:(S)-citramalyl-CoA lyase
MLGLQSLLFVPGSRPERFAKALASGADAVCIDLEDAVPFDGKEAARRAALSVMGDPRLIIRPNAFGTAVGQADISAILGATQKPRLILLPMVEDPFALAAATSEIVAAGIGIIPLIETPKGLRNAHLIAAAPGVVALMFGGADFAAALGVELAWEPLATARAQLLIAAAEAGVPVIDVPWVRMDDPAGLEEECQRAKMMGFAGKAAIHPDQVATIHSVFRPTAEQIIEAKEAVSAYAATGGAAVRFKGRMLEAPFMRRYQQILDLKDSVDA